MITVLHVRDDTPIDNCIKEALEILRSQMPAGIPSLDIPPLDPFLVPHLDIPHIE